MADEPFEVADPSGLSDADWADINRVRRAYETGGKDALEVVLEELAQDPIRYVRVIGAIFSDMIREAIKDEMADLGMDEEDLRRRSRSLHASSNAPACSRQKSRSIPGSERVLGQNNATA